jgi:hypothetical protein
MGKPSAIPKELIVHVSFHLFWAVLALLSLVGVFLFIPFIGIYETFVLGFVFQAMPDSRIVAYAIGIMVFILTGMASAGVRKLFRKSTSWMAGVLSLIPTVVVLVVISFALLASGINPRGALVGASPAADLSDTGDFDELGVWIKAAYYLPKHPPFVANAASIVRLETALPASSKATSVPPPKVSGWYLNLDAECWSALRSGATSPVLVAWSDATNEQCSVVQLNLKTDVAAAESMQQKEFERLYKSQHDLIGQLCPNAQLPESPPSK